MKRGWWWWTLELVLTASSMLSSFDEALAPTSASSLL